MTTFFAYYEEVLQELNKTFYPQINWYHIQNFMKLYRNLDDPKYMIYIDYVIHRIMFRYLFFLKSYSPNVCYCQMLGNFVRWVGYPDRFDTNMLRLMASIVMVETNTRCNILVCETGVCLNFLPILTLTPTNMLNYQ